MPKYVLLCILLIVSSAVVCSASQTGPTEEKEICLGCHASKDLSITFKSGESVSAFVDDQRLRNSVHSKLDCSSCHKGFTTDSHPKRTFKTRRAYQAQAAEVCRSCHTINKAIHMRMLGGISQFLCTDCHGAHSVKQAADADSCINCHRHSLTMALANGEKVSIRVNADDIRQSVHSKLRCYDCHFGFSLEEHPARKFKSTRDMAIVNSEGCRRCHFDKYTKTLESIHYDILSSGNLSAPVCVDCHGAHSIFSGRKEKLVSAKRCEKCHPDIYKTYSESVHGYALRHSEHSQDVPVCSDCHRAHDIVDPRTVDFRNMTPEMCGNCHANEELMARHGLSTAVLKSYLEDFHGVTVTFYKKQKKAVRHIAVCTDCHGIHDITKTKGANSTVLKSKLLKRCQKCHPDAKENFPDAWISHYEPTFKRAPLVYAINLIYKVFIPFMLIGLILQILLHIWRYAVNR